MSQISQQRYGCYIGNIDRSVTLEVLRQVFSQCGVIIDCSLNGRDEDPYRYGFIDFATEDDRARAMKYNGFTLAGRKIKVGVSKGNVGRPDGFTHTSNNSHNNTHNNNNNNNANNQQHQQHQQQQQQQSQQPSQIPPVPLAASFLPGVMQQQQSAQLLMQLIQQGAIDVNNLTPEQQQILMASLLPQTAPPPPVQGMPAMPQAPQMSYPQMQQAWGGVRGGGGGGGGMYGGGLQMGRGVPYNRGPANPMPSEETVKLREVQRKQFLEVVRRDAEKYERKLQERSVKEGRAGSGSGSEESSSSGEGGKRRQAHGRRDEDDGENERGRRLKMHRAETDKTNYNNQQNSNGTDNNNNNTGAEAHNNNTVYSSTDVPSGKREMSERIELEEPGEVESPQGADDRERI